MATNFRNPRLTSVAMVLVVLATMSACSSESGQGLTLAQSKSPVQLLRNEVASRVPADSIESIIQSKDESTACRTIETDPEGLLRSWRSVARYALKYGEAFDSEPIVANIVTTFVDQGWVEGSYGTAAIIELTREGSETTIHISQGPGDDETETGAHIQLTVAGPCVMTDGADSDEVRLLDSVEG